MCSPTVAIGVASIGLGVFGQIRARNAEEARLKYQAAVQQHQMREQRRISWQTWREQVLSIQQGYLDQVRSRQWNFLQARHQYDVGERNSQQAARERQFQFGMQELARRKQYDEQLSAVKRADVAEQGSVGLHNEDVEMQYMIDQQTERMSRLQEDLKQELEGVSDNIRADIAKQKYNVTISGLVVQVAQAKADVLAGLDEGGRKTMLEQGAVMASQPAGLTRQRMVVNRAAQELNMQQRAQQQIAMAEGIKEQKTAEARLVLAESLLRQRTGRRAVLGAVRGARRSFVANARPPGWRAGVAPVRYLRDVAPIKGPSIRPPRIPKRPIFGTAPQAHVPSSTVGNVLSVLQGGFQAYNVIAPHLKHNRVNTGLSYTSAGVPYTPGSGPQTPFG